MKKEKGNQSQLITQPTKNAKRVIKRRRTRRVLSKKDKIRISIEDAMREGLIKSITQDLAQMSLPMIQRAAIEVRATTLVTAIASK